MTEAALPGSNMLTGMIPSLPASGTEIPEQFRPIIVAPVRRERDLIVIVSRVGMCSVTMTMVLSPASSASKAARLYALRRLVCSSPSTGMFRPLIQLARGEARKATTCATSSGFPNRPIG